MRQLKGSLFTRSICFSRTLSNPCWALVKRKLIIIMDYKTTQSHYYPCYHWFSCDSWRPKWARHVWGRSVKCLGLIAGVSFAHLTPSLWSLFFAFPPIFFFFFGTPSDRAEKRLRMRAVDSFWRTFWCVFDRLINESLPPWTTLFLRVISWWLPPWTRWNLTNFENNPIQQEVSDLPNLFRGNVGGLAILKPANCGKCCSTLTAPLGE